MLSGVKDLVGTLTRKRATVVEDDNEFTCLEEKEGIDDAYMDEVRGANKREPEQKAGNSRRIRRQRTHFEVGKDDPGKFQLWKNCLRRYYPS